MPERLSPTVLSPLESFVKNTGSSSRNRRPVAYIVAAVLTLVLVGGFVAIQGNVSGTEFSPTHFRTREFSFYEIPLVHVQLTPITRTDRTGPVERQLRAKTWIKAPNGPPPEPWHLVTIRRGTRASTAHASLLVEEMQLTELGKYFWKRWNVDYPKRATVLWPLVQRLAERELYVLIPELLARARSLSGQDDAQEFLDDVTPWLIEQYASLIGDLRDANRNVLADEILTEALKDHPDARVLIDLKAT